MADLYEQLLFFEKVSKSPRELMERYLAEGYKIIGCFPYYNVQPIITALDMVPMGMWGAQISPQLAGRYSPIFTCSMTRSCLELGMRNSYRKMSAAVIPILCDTLRGEVTAWRAGVKDIPIIPYVPPQNRKDPGALDYYIEEIKYVAGHMEKISGKILNNETLQKALDLYNERNSSIRKFLKSANEHLDIITPKVRHCIMKAISFLKPEEAKKSIEELLESLEKEPVYIPSGKKVVLTGIAVDSEKILDALAKSKIHVVADDLAQESRLYNNDYPMSCSALESFARQWMNIKGCSLVHDDDAFARGKGLVDLAEKVNADAVILCMMRFCDIEEYDQPYVTKMIRDAGFMTISIDIDQSVNDDGQAVTKIQAMSEM